MYWSGKKTFSYNHELDKWDLDEPELNLGRSDHAVGIVTDGATQDQFVIVTGGSGGVSKSYNLNSTEVLLAGNWSLGESL